MTATVSESQSVGYLSFICVAITNTSEIIGISSNYHQFCINQNSLYCCPITYAMAMVFLHENMWFIMYDLHLAEVPWMSSHHCAP